MKEHEKAAADIRRVTIEGQIWARQDLIEETRADDGAEIVRLMGETDRLRAALVRAEKHIISLASKLESDPDIIADVTEYIRDAISGSHQQQRGE